MRFRSLFTAVTTALVIAVGGSSAARADIFLPTGNCGLTSTNNCLVFDDFNVYSLAVLNYQFNQSPIKPGDPYDVSTNGNALRDALVIGTGASGAVNNKDVIASGAVDDAYNTPNSQGGGTTNFQTSAATANTDAPTSLIPGNTTGTWDIMVGDLLTYLNGGNMAFFFNLNQTNTTSYLNNPQDALGWLSVTLTDTTGGNGSITFWLDGNACDGDQGGDPSHCDHLQSYAQPQLGDPGYPEAAILPNDPDHDEWAYIHGQVCMSPAGAIVSFGACPKGSSNTTVNQNLGAGNAAFALYSEALELALRSGDYDKMSVDFRMAAIDNGYEQLLILPSLHIPEPITMMMFGAGLLGLAGLRRRKLKTA